MHVIYRISFLPHIKNKTPPFYYVGSKYNYNKKPNYLGSLSSKQKAWYTGELSVGEWWKFQTKKYPENFKLEILKVLENISPKEIVKLEREYQKDLNILSEDYFNFAFATENFVSCKKTPETIKQMSDSTKQFWSSPEGLEKRKRLSDRNRLTKSTEQIKKWKNPTIAMINRYTPGRPKGSKNLPFAKLRPEKQVKINGKIYENAKIAAKEYNIDPINVRRKCRLPQYKDWEYIENSDFK